jgi:hypothetical protein
MMMSWINDNAIVGQESVGQESNIMELKKALMNQFECKDCGPMDEYVGVGCMIEKLKTGGVKFRQNVLLQSYRDEFDILKLKKFNTPAAPETGLRKPDKGEEILAPAEQTQYHSVVGKGMHMMQYSRPDTYNAVRVLARHMTSSATQVHYDTMLRMMKYVDDTSDLGWESRRHVGDISARQPKFGTFGRLGQVLPTQIRSQHFFCVGDCQLSLNFL